MNLGMRFREAVAQAKHGIVDEFEQLIGGIMSGWTRDHLVTGHHANVRAITVYATDSFRERERLANMGEWTSYTPTLSGGGTQTLAPGDTPVCNYAQVGLTLFLSFWIRAGIVGGGANPELRVSIPAGMKVLRDWQGAFAYSDNGTPGTGRWVASTSATYISFYLNNLGNWTASAGTTEILFNGCVAIAQQS